jgi:hypothetical protein
MPEFIYCLSSIQLFTCLTVVLFVISLIAVSLVSRYISLDFRYKENPAVVSCSALLSIIYAVLIGFIILYQLSTFETAKKSESLEGVTLHSIYYNAALLPKPHDSNLRSLVLAYTKNAIYNEWPALGQGQKISPEGKILIEKMAHEIQGVHNLRNPTNNAINLLNKIEQEISLLFETHHERIATVHTTLNEHIWFVLLLGTLFTLAINYFLGMEFRLHILCVSLIAIILSALIYLIVGLDRPYQGDFVVCPHTIESVLEEDLRA